MSMQDDHELAFKHLNEITAAGLSEVWLANALRNIETSRRHGRLQDISPDRNMIALVCGSGKSLDLHIEMMRQYRARLCICAVDVAYPVLLQHGIEPDFAITMDPAESLRQCFEGMPECRSGSLIAATITHPEVIASWRGKIYFYNLFDPNTPVLMEIAHQFAGFANIESKFNVGELALFMTSVFWRFRHIGFTGLDLAYWRNEYYAAGVRQGFAGDSSERVILWNNENRPTVTTRRFALYMQAFMQNYRDIYSTAASIYCLSRGIIPLKYRLEDFECVLLRGGALP